MTKHQTARLQLCPLFTVLCIKDETTVMFMNAGANSMSLYEAVKGNLLSGIAGYGLLSQSTHNMESYVLFVWLQHNIIIKRKDSNIFM